MVGAKKISGVVITLLLYFISILLLVEFFDKESKISLALYNTRELYPQYSIYKHGASTVSNSKVSTKYYPSLNLKYGNLTAQLNTGIMLNT